MKVKTNVETGIENAINEAKANGVVYHFGDVFETPDGTWKVIGTNNINIWKVEGIEAADGEPYVNGPIIFIKLAL